MLGRKKKRKNTAAIESIHLFSYIGKERKLAISIIISLIITSLSIIFFGKIIGMWVENLGAHKTIPASSAAKKEGLIGIAFLTTGLIFATFSFVRIMLSRIMSERITIKIIKDYLHKIFLTHNVADEAYRTKLISFFTSEIEKIKIFLSQTLPFLTRNILIISLSIIGMMIVSWKLSLFMICFAVIIWLIAKPIKRKMNYVSKSYRKSLAGVNQFLVQTVTNSKKIYVDNASSEFVKRYSNIAEQYFKCAKFRGKIYGASFGFLISCLIFVLFGLAAFTGSLLENGHISSQQLTSFIFYALLLIVNLSSMLEKLDSCFEVVNSSRNIFADFGNIVALVPEEEKFDDHHNIIEFTNVDFGYADKSLMVLQNLSFEVKEESGLTCIAGKSGAGKSSCIDLLLAIKNPSQGIVKLFGHDMTHLTQNQIFSYYQQLSVCFQHEEIMSDSLKNNLFLNHAPSAGETKEAIELVKELDLDIIDSDHAENPLESMIGPGHRSLSGGEEKRIAIIRALLKKDSKLFIFDEPTNHLDRANRKIVIEKIVGLSKMRSVLIITHDEELIKRADKVITI